MVPSKFSLHRAQRRFDRAIPNAWHDEENQGADDDIEWEIPTEIPFGFSPLLFWISNEFQAQDTSMFI